jgi:hypothetical protein
MDFRSEDAMKSTIQTLMFLLSLQATSWAQGINLERDSEVAVEQVRFAPLPHLPGFETSQAVFTANASTRFVPLPALEDLPPAPVPLVELAEALTPDSYPTQKKNEGSDAARPMLKTEGLEALQRNLDPFKIVKSSDAAFSSNGANLKSIEDNLKKNSGLSGIENRPDPRYLSYWPSINSSWESPAFCYKPLYFEQPNLERYGIGYGCPTNALVSGGKFFVDAALLPVNLVRQPPKSCECTLGHRRPGSCAPIQR